MKNAILILLLLQFGFAKAQSDMLQLKTGEEKKVVLVLDEMPTENSTLKYKLFGKEKIEEISMTKVHKLTLSDGYVLYEDDEPLEIKKETPKPAPTATNTDKMYLKTGEEKSVVLILEEMPTSNSVLFYKNVGNDTKLSISMTKVKKLVLSDGYVLYETADEPAKEEPNKETVVAEEVISTSTIDSLARVKEQEREYQRKQQAIYCSQTTENLKKEFDYEAVKLYDQINAEIEQKKTSFSAASYNMTEKVKNDLYKYIKDEVLLLRSSGSSVDALLTVYVGADGKVLNQIDEVKNAKYLRNYTQLREETIYPYFRNGTFPTADTIFDYTNQIKAFLISYKEKFLKTDCPDEFTEIYKIAENRLEGVEKTIVPKSTVYKIPITYTFDSKYQTWIKYKSLLQIKNKGGNIDVKNKDVKEDFYAKFKKPRNGKYSVFTHYYKALDDSLKMSIQSAKRKYIYYIHLGANIGTVFPIKPNPTLSIGEIMPIEGFLIFHRIGFFGGYGLQFTQPYKNEVLDGNYYENVKYFHGGLYIGLAQYFYIKVGYAQLNYSNVEYNNDFEINREKDLKRYGFLAGFSLVFPVVQFEGGYNYTLRSPYVSGGLNIPINR